MSALLRQPLTALHDSRAALVRRGLAERAAWLVVGIWLAWDICALWYWASDSYAVLDSVWIAPLLVLFSAYEITPARDIPGRLGQVARGLAGFAFGSVFLVAFRWWFGVAVALGGPSAVSSTSEWPRALSSCVAALVVGFQVVPPLVRTLDRAAVRRVCLAIAGLLIWRYSPFPANPGRWIDNGGAGLAKLFVALASAAILYGLCVAADHYRPRVSEHLGRRIPGWLTAHWTGSGPRWPAWAALLLAVGGIVGLMNWRDQDVGNAEDGYASSFRLSIYWPCVMLLCYVGAMPLWRSMSRLARPRPWWATGTRRLVGTGMGILVFCTLFIWGPMVGEALPGVVSHALHADWQVSVLPDSTGVQVRGKISYGLAEALDRIVKAHPDIKSIHLDSTGGNTGIAAKVAAIIHDAGLTTYVTRDCASACTLIFSAGRERVLVRGGGLGYHSMRTPIPGLLRRSDVAAEDKLLVGYGVDPSFIRKANAVRPEDMWYPTDQELLKAGVVTRVE